jgi:hypothetical protein
MAEYILKVPLVAQMSEQDVMQQKDVNGVRRWSGENACWYASACMVAYYYEPGPRQGIPQIWLDNIGLYQYNISLLARVEGLKAVPKPRAGLTSDTLIDLLKTHGPIWASGSYGGGGGGHAIVITGVRDKTVFYNDPWEPRAKMTTCEWIDANLLSSPYAMLARDTSAVRPPFLKKKSPLSPS